VCVCVCVCVCVMKALLEDLNNFDSKQKYAARLVLRSVTVSGFNSPCGTFISVCDQPPKSTQPGYPLVGRRNEYQPKGGDALRLGSKGRYGSCLAGSDPLVTRDSYLSALAVVLPIIRRYTNNRITLTRLLYTVRSTI